MIDRNSPWFKLYDKGVPYTIPYPPVTVKHLFNVQAEAHPDRDYLIINETRLPYGLVNLISRKLANSLASLGVQKGERHAPEGRGRVPDAGHARGGGKGARDP